jgi:biopolymer transport protein ExbB/TolQ
MPPEPVNGTINVWQMIQQGWISTYPLNALSVISFTIIGERLWSLRGILGSTAALTRVVYADLTKGEARAAFQHVEAQQGVPAGRIYKEVLRHTGDLPIDDLEQLASERRFEEIERLKGLLWVLGTVASSAPFIGLFGTVIGIVKAFHSMAIMGSGGFAVVAGGISEALVATALGLFVAIIALIAYNYFQVRLDRIEAALTIGATRVLEALRMGRRAEAPAGRVADGRL